MSDPTAPLNESDVEQWRRICLSHWAANAHGQWLTHEESARQANALADLALTALRAQQAQPEPTGEQEVRWVIDGRVYGRPTGTDALEYAERVLADPEEMECCRTDKRLPRFHLVRDLLSP